MLIFGIDTSCACAKAALAEDGVLLAELYANDMRTHSVKLMPMIDEVFKTAGRTLEDVELVGVVTGPGSFTGLRIGVATAKALAYAAKLPLVGINTLDFLAASVSNADGYVVCPAIDARNNSVYCNFYMDGETQADCCVRNTEEAQQYGEKLARELGRKLLFTGDGAAKYFQNALIAHDSEVLGTASALCALTGKMQACAVDPFTLNVNYYRQTQAERMKNAGK